MLMPSIFGNDFMNFLNYSENYIILAERAIVFIAHFHVKYAAFMLHYINI